MRSDLDTLRAIRNRYAPKSRAEAKAEGNLVRLLIDDRAVLLDMVERYRRRFLDIAEIAGADTSGLDHPDQLAHPAIDELAVEEVTRLRESYDEALREAKP